MAFTFSPWPPQNLENALDLVAGVDHHGFARLLVAEDGAVALQQADRQNFVNHSVYSTVMPDEIAIPLRWLHIASMTTLLGGIVFWRLVLARAGVG